MNALKYHWCETSLLSQAVLNRPESIMLQNLPIMLFGISLIFCLLCLFLCFLDMDYADISCFQSQKFTENDHGKNEMNF